MGRSSPPRSFAQRGPQTILRTNQMDPDRKLTAGLNGALDLRLGSFVRTHGIERNIRERGHRKS